MRDRALGRVGALRHTDTARETDHMITCCLIYCPRENPRLCRGGCQSLTFPGVCSSPFGRASLASVQRHSLHHGRLRKGPFEGPATVKPPALPEDIYLAIYEINMLAGAGSA